MAYVQDNPSVLGTNSPVGLDQRRITAGTFDDALASAQQVLGKWGIEHVEERS
jgi:hypothetical protein